MSSAWVDESPVLFIFGLSSPSRNETSAERNKVVKYSKGPAGWHQGEGCRPYLDPLGLVHAEAKVATAVDRVPFTLGVLGRVRVFL
jgi:hypothetical protein